MQIFDFFFFLSSQIGNTMASHPKEHVFQDNQEKEITEDALQKY